MIATVRSLVRARLDRRLLERLRIDAQGTINLHVSHYQKDTADARAEILRLHDHIIQLENALSERGAVEGETQRLRAALTRAKKLCDVALPQFNWGKSVLTGEAIRLLNEVPGEIAAALHPD